MNLDLSKKKLSDNFFSTKEMSFWDLIKGDEFLVPQNQRAWEWGEKDLSKVWGDITRKINHNFDNKYKHRENEPDPHYFGSIALRKNDDSKLEIIDGQQRITATCILFKCLEDCFKKLADKTTDKHIEQEAKKQGRGCQQWFYADISKQTLKVALEEDYHKWAKGYIFDPAKVEDREEFKASNPPSEGKQIGDAFDSFSKIIEAGLPVDDQERLNFLEAVVEVYKHWFIICRIDVQDEIFGYQVFKSLNTTGKLLEISDRIKNELFIIGSTSNRALIKNKWNDISGLVQPHDMSTFLWYRHIAKFQHCSKKSTYETVFEKEIESQSDPIKILDHWEGHAQYMGYIINAGGHPEFDKKEHAQARDEIDYLNKILNATAGIPFLTLAAETYFPKNQFKEFSDLVHATYVYIFRDLTVSKKKQNEVLKAFTDACKKLRDGKTVEELVDHFKAQSPDLEFKDNFTKFAPKNTDLQFFILNQIEKELGSGGLVPDGKGPLKNHVEHIMPRKPDTKDPGRKKEWSHITKEQREENLNRLGNLLILESEINIQVSNFSYDTKTTGSYPDKPTKSGMKPRKFKDRKTGKLQAGKSYKDSMLYMPRELISKGLRLWGLGNINDRQKELAGHALNIWKF